MLPLQIFSVPKPVSLEEFRILGIEMRPGGKEILFSMRNQITWERIAPEIFKLDLKNIPIQGLNMNLEEGMNLQIHFNPYTLEEHRGMHSFDKILPGIWITPKVEAT